MVVTPGDPFPANVLPENTQVPSKEELLGDVTFQDMVIKYEVPVVHVAPETVVHVLERRVNELLAADLYNKPPETEPAVVACVARVASVAKVAVVARVASVAKVAVVARVAVVASVAKVADEAKPALVAAPALVAKPALVAELALVARVASVAKVAVVARVAVVANVAKVAVVASVARVAVDALIDQEPDAPVPVGEGTSVPITSPKFVLAPDAVVAPVPPLATAKVPVRFVACSS